jgi:hypothetical protein
MTGSVSPSVPARDPGFFRRGTTPPPAWGEVGGTSPPPSSHVLPANSILGTLQFRSLKPAVPCRAEGMRLCKKVRHSQLSRGVGGTSPPPHFFPRGVHHPTLHGERWGVPSPLRLFLGRGAPLLRHQSLGERGAFAMLRVLPVRELSNPQLYDKDNIYWPVWLSPKH